MTQKLAVLKNKIIGIEAKIIGMEAVLDKEEWTPEEIARYGNKEILSVEKDLLGVSMQLMAVELLFEQDFDTWSSKEKKRYGKEEDDTLKQLRKKEEQLREQQTVLLRLKEKASLK
jgi:hypothetical protein